MKNLQGLIIIIIIIMIIIIMYKIFDKVLSLLRKPWKTEELDMAKKGKPEQGNWISSNSSTKQHNKDQIY